MTNDEIKALEKRVKTACYILDPEGLEALAQLRAEVERLTRENERLTRERDAAITKCYELEDLLSDQTVKAKAAERERDEEKAIQEVRLQRERAESAELQVEMLWEVLSQACKWLDSECGLIDEIQVADRIDILLAAAAPETEKKDD